MLPLSMAKGNPSSLSDLDRDDAMSSHESEDSSISDDPVANSGLDN